MFNKWYFIVRGHWRDRVNEPWENVISSIIRRSDCNHLKGRIQRFNIWDDFLITSKDTVKLICPFPSNCWLIIEITYFIFCQCNYLSFWRAKNNTPRFGIKFKTPLSTIWKYSWVGFQKHRLSRFIDQSICSISSWIHQQLFHDINWFHIVYISSPWNPRNHSSIRGMHGYQISPIIKNHKIKPIWAHCDFICLILYTLIREAPFESCRFNIKSCYYWVNILIKSRQWIWPSEPACIYCIFIRIDIVEESPIIIVSEILWKVVVASWRAIF